MKKKTQRYQGNQSDWRVMERGKKEKEMRAGLGNVGVIRRDTGRLLPVYPQPLPSAQGGEKEDKVMK